MKKVLLYIIVSSLYFNAFAQKYKIELHAGTLWDKGFNNFMFQKNTFAYTQTSNHAMIGINASRKISKQFSVVSGYNFTYRYLEVNLFANNPVNSFSGAKLYSHSVPLLLEYRHDFLKFDGKSVFARIGGGIEIFTPEYKLFGMYNSETVFTVTYKYGLFYTIYPPKNPIPYIQGYIGFGDNLGKNGNVSIGLGYKLLLSTFKYEMYYYFNNSFSPEVEQTFSLTKQVSEVNICFTYSFGVQQKKSEEKKE